MQGISKTLQGGSIPMSSLKASIRQMGGKAQVLLTELGNAPTLAAMMLVAWHLARVLAVKLVEEELKKRAQSPPEWSQCPKCGKRLESKGFIERSLRGLIGLVRWERRVGRCPGRCKIGLVAPLDEELGLRPNQRVSDALKRAASALAVFVPFGEARELLALLTGIEVSPGSIWNWVQQVGAEAKAWIEREVKALKAGEQPVEEEIEAEVAKLPLVSGADGVMVPFRPNGGQPEGRTVWREVKVGILARVKKRVTQTGKTVTQLVRRRLVAVLGDIDDLQPRLWNESVRQGILTAKTVVWLSDGGKGFWRLFRERFEQHAQGILDFYHAAENVWKGAKAWLDGRTKQAQAWFVLSRRKLRQGKADEVLTDIKAALDLDGLPAAARKALTNLYTYLDTHRDHIDYARFKQLGLPIGSGLVESACKWLIQQRFKGVGMRWSNDGFDHLLHLRLFWVNGRFDALFDLATLAQS